MLRAGLIGFPSVGKTTLFQLMTAAVDGAHPGHGKADAQIGVARVPDPRLDRLTAIFNPRKRVPATVETADMAGATRADAKALLDVVSFRNADALLHVVRLFRDETVPHAAGKIDPARDAQAMEDELILADLGVVERRLERLARDLKKGATTELQREQHILVDCQAALEAGRPLRTLELAADDRRRVRGFQFLSAKPLLLVLNLDEADIARSADAVALGGLAGIAGHAGVRTVPVCAKIELEISRLDAEDAAAFLADLQLKESGLDRVIQATYDLLGYMSFFTVGEDECRAWSIPRGTPAQVAAGEIHSDIARGFIRAEVVGYDSFIARGSMAACKEKGEVRLEGKEYVVQDGDIINFRFAT
jgi:GTP-binding protein YchF